MHTVRKQEQFSLWIVCDPDGKPLCDHRRDRDAALVCADRRDRGATDCTADFLEGGDQ